MKRYSHACAAGMVESVEGRWVRWEDVSEEITRLRSENEGLSEMYDDLYKHHAATYHTGELVDTEIVLEENVRLREALEKITANVPESRNIALAALSNN